eukprot:scaffold2009_cov156-Skeletonema_marinoi.AAC.9
MKLSQQAIYAEAARVNAANIKPLVWAKPTFEIDSPAADTATDDVAAAADETQAEESSEAAREIDSPTIQDGCQLVKKFKRLSSLLINGCHLRNEDLLGVETMMKRSRNRQKRLAKHILSIAVAYYRVDENNIIANKLVLCVEASSLAIVHGSIYT